MRRISFLIALGLFTSFLALGSAKDDATKKKDDVAKHEGSLYVLGLSINQQPQADSWSRVGEEGAWSGVLAGAVFKKWIYTIDSDDSLQKADPATGKRTRIGKAEYRDTPFLLAGNDHLYAIQLSGNLFRINPEDGSRIDVGAKQAWQAVKAAVIFQGSLYTAETDGTIQKTDLTTGQRTSVGKAEFRGTTFLFAAFDKLYLIKGDGDLFKVDPKDGSCRQVGDDHAWKAVRAGTILNGRVLYTIEKIEGEGEGDSGTTKLWTTDLVTGKHAKFGKKEFGDMDHMLVLRGTIYTIENNGNMYKVGMDASKDRDGMSEANSYPQEIEKVFRKRGTDFYKDFKSQLILGNQVTHQKVQDGLAQLRQQATEKDLVVVYFVGHGFCNPTDGWAFPDADGTWITTSLWKEELAKLPCHVIVMFESCNSGGFVEYAGDVPPNVTALCSSSSNEVCMSEFHISLLEALYGRADFNKNGIVEVDELIQYVRLRLQEEVYGYPQEGEGEGGDEGKEKYTKATPVLVKAKTLVGTRPLTRVASNLTTILHKGVLWSALLKKQIGDRFKVQVLGWDSRPSPFFLTNEVTRDHIFLPTDGKPVMVKQDNDTWRAARLLGKEGDKLKIQYMPRGEEESVAKEQVKYPFASNP